MNSPRRAAKGQADVLDYIVDNVETDRREVYRNGELKAYTHRTCISAPLMKVWGAVGEWGTFPSRPIAQDRP